MHVRHPIWIRRLGAPGAEAFAILFALESFARAILATVIPLEALELLGRGDQVSLLFFLVSAIGLCGSFSVPWFVRRTARRWVYTAGALLLVVAGVFLAQDTLTGQFLGMASRVLGVVAMTICISLYIMDSIPRRDLGRAEPMRLFYSAGAWTAGPALGVFLRTEVAESAPYVVSAVTGLVMLGYFWFLRLGDRPEIGPPMQARVPGPLRNLRRFLAQPRLRLAWLIAVGRNAWWAMFFIYTPIYAVQSGLGEVAGGVIVSLGTGLLFLMPIWGWCVRRFGIRRILVSAFGCGGVLTLAVAAGMDTPWLAAVFLLAAAFSMTVMDAAGNMPFMLAVRPSERARMTSVYATYRDMAELAPPGLFSVLLRAFDLGAVFVVGGASVLMLAGLCRRMHPRLGRDARPAVARVAA